MTDVLQTTQSEIKEWTKQFKENESKAPEFNSNKEWVVRLTVVMVNKLHACGISITTPTLYACVSAAIEEVGIPLQELAPFLGMVEEIGELAGTMVKRHQGRGHHDYETYHNNLKDGVADLDIFTNDFCNRVEVNRAASLEETWRVVKERSQKSWEQDKANEVFVSSKGPQERPDNGISIGVDPNHPQITNCVVNLNEEDEEDPRKTPTIVKFMEENPGVLGEGFDVARCLVSWLLGKDQEDALKMVERREAEYYKNLYKSLCKK